jgi:acetyl-CoA acyltransferase
VKQLREAYIVAATRTPIGKAPRGMLRTTRPDDMLAHVIRSVVAQAPGFDPAEINDVVAGCAFPEAESGLNFARIAALLAGLPKPWAASPSTAIAHPASTRSAKSPPTASAPAKPKP